MHTVRKAGAADAEIVCGCALARKSGYRTPGRVILLVGVGNVRALPNTVNDGRVVG